MPISFIKQAERPMDGILKQASVDLSPLQNDIASLRGELQATRDNTKPGKQTTALGDGYILEQEPGRETVRRIRKPQ